MSPGAWCLVLGARFSQIWKTGKEHPGPCWPYLEHRLLLCIWVGEHHPVASLSVTMVFVLVPVLLRMPFGAKSPGFCWGQMWSPGPASSRALDVWEQVTYSPRAGTEGSPEHSPGFLSRSCHTHPAPASSSSSSSPEAVASQLEPTVPVVQEDFY